MLQELAAAARASRLQQIAVIGPAAKDKGSLADVSEVDGVPFRPTLINVRAGGVLVTTARLPRGWRLRWSFSTISAGLAQFFKREDLYVSGEYRARRRC